MFADNDTKIKCSGMQLLLLCGLFLILCHSFSGVRAQSNSQQRGFQPATSYAVGDIETINTTNGNLLLNIPLAALPEGRGDNSGMGVRLVYNSKLWDAPATMVPNGFDGGAGSSGSYTFEPRHYLHQSPDGGWRIALRYNLEVVNRLDEMRANHSYQVPGCPNLLAQYVWKVRMHLPDGGVANFVLEGEDNSYYGDNFLSTRPDGWKTLCRNVGMSWEQITVPYLTRKLTYYSTDGNYLRLDINHDGDDIWGNNSWVLSLPDGSRITGGGMSGIGSSAQNTAGPQYIYDRNNNRIEIISNGNYQGQPATQIIDSVGRAISIVTDANAGQTYIYKTGAGNVELKWTIKWKRIGINKTYGTCSASGTCTAMAGPPTKEFVWNMSVVDEIILPVQSGGLSYKFTYNARDYDSNNTAPTVGWGEVSSVTMPSGARVDYTYLDDGVDGLNWEALLNNYPKQKDLTYQREYDEVSTPTTETWHYEIGSPNATRTWMAGYSTITAPDGGVTRNEIEQGNPPAGNWERGLVYRTINPDGSMVEKLWQENTPYGFTNHPAHLEHKPSINPYVKTEFVSIKNAAGTYVKTAIKDYNYDKNGNVTRIAEYDWVPYQNVPRTDPGYGILGKPTGLPTGSNAVAPRRVTTNTYHYPTPDASDRTTDNQHVYRRSTSPQLRKSLASTVIGDGTNVLARTEFTYDDAATTGNLIQQRSWDSMKGALGPAGNELDVNNSISTSHQYDDNTQDPAQRFGNRTLTTDAEGVQTFFVYGAVNGVTGLYPTKVHVAYNTPVEQVTTQAYDFYSGVEIHEIDPNGVVTATDHDAFGRPTLVTAAQGLPEETRTETEYSDAARRVIVRREMCRAGDAGCAVNTKLVNITHYDQLGRVRLSRELEDAATQSETDEKTGVKVQTRYLYSGAHSYELVSNPYRAATSGAATAEETMGWSVTKSDQGARNIEMRTVAGAELPSPWGANANTNGVTQTSYDANSTTITNPSGKVQRNVFDSLRKLVRVDEPNASNDPGPVDSPYQPTSYEYDPLLNLVLTRQGGTIQSGQYQGGQTRTFQYSSLSRLVSGTNPENGTISYTYDGEGNLHTKHDARGITTTFVYDQLDRVRSKTYSDGTPQVTYTYDAPAVSYSRGRLTAVSTAASTTHYNSYSALGQVRTHEQMTGGQSYAMSYVYDRAGNLISQTYPSGRTVTTAYDSGGEITGVAGQKAGETAKTYASSFGYTPGGHITQVKLGNGLWEHTSYNSHRQPLQIALGTSLTDTSLWRLNYGFAQTTNDGNIQSQTITVPGLVLQQSYEYDELDRLKMAKEVNGATETWKQTFAYDAYGNRRFDAAQTTSPQITGVNESQTNPTISGANNRISSPGFRYDTAGNLECDPQHPCGTVDPFPPYYAYDAENRVKTANSGASYVYDGDGRRVKKVVDTSVTVFVYDVNGHIVAEYGTDAPGQHGTSYLTADHLGTPRVITTASGQARARRDFMPFGEEVTASTGNRHTVPGYGTDGGVRQKFTGKERDWETGLDYFLARYYSSSHGRFTSPDEFTGGPDELYDFADAAAENPTFYADLDNPQTLNKYQYCFNNPINAIDPDGHKGWKQWARSAVEVATYIPGPVGIVASGVQTVDKLAQGDYKGAMASAAGAVPGVKQIKLAAKVATVGVVVVATTVKVTSKAAKAADKVADVGKGVVSGRHNANIRILSDGKTVSKSREVSGNMTAKQKAMGFPKGSLASHTEAKAIRNNRLKAGQEMRITGQLPPCPTCKGVMNKAARETGAKIRYRWRQDGRTHTWEAN
jgi:RHS repeat-associated protein